MILIKNRFDGAENWSSNINGNCILSTFDVNPSAQRKLIANDKDWDLYSYDRDRQTCRNRDSVPDLSTKRGEKILIFNFTLISFVRFIIFSNNSYNNVMRFL